MFGRFPNLTVHPDHAIGLGAAVQAGLLARDAALDEVRLTDVCPFTLGVDHAERDARGVLHTGLFSPIIDRNTPIPASRVGYYRTIVDNQDSVEFGVYQGEARDVSANVKLGSLRIPVPRRPAGDVEVECRFSYDTSGLLEIDVSVPASGVKKQLSILEGADDLTAEDLARRQKALAALKIHPREESENIALMARAKRCYEGYIGVQRDMIGAWILEFEGALESQDARRIATIRDEVSARLDALEGDQRL